MRMHNPAPASIASYQSSIQGQKKKNRTKETKIWENKVPSLVTQTWDNLSETFPFLLPFSSFSFVVVVNPFSLQAPSYLSLSSLYIMNSINKNVDLGTLRIENTNQVLLKIDQSLWCFPGKKWPVKTAVPEQPWAMQVQSRCLFLFYFVFFFFYSLFVFLFFGHCCCVANGSVWFRRIRLPSSAFLLLGHPSIAVEVCPPLQPLVRTNSTRSWERRREKIPKSVK